MPVDISTIATVRPTELPVTDATAGIDISALGKTVPQIPRVVTAKLAPVIQAGVILAGAVLSITALSIVILGLALILSELQSSANIKAAYTQALSEVSRSSPDNGKAELLLAQLHRARADAAWNLEASDLKEAQSTLLAIQTSSYVTADQKKTLQSCLPIQADTATRSGLIDKCTDLIGSLAATMDSTGSRVKAIVDLAKQAGDQQQAFRTFWVQAAQLILLNLLLPILTALLGYIFGTTQAPRSSR